MKAQKSSSLYVTFKAGKHRVRKGRLGFYYAFWRIEPDRKNVGEIHPLLFGGDLYS